MGIFRRDHCDWLFFVNTTLPIALFCGSDCFIETNSKFLFKKLLCKGFFIRIRRFTFHVTIPSKKKELKEKNFQTCANVKTISKKGRKKNKGNLCVRIKYEEEKKRKSVFSTFKTQILNV